MAGPMPAAATSSAKPMKIMQIASRPKSAGGSSRARTIPALRLSKVCPNTLRKFQKTPRSVRCLCECVGESNTGKREWWRLSCRELQAVGMVAGCGQHAEQHPEGDIAVGSCQVHLVVDEPAHQHAHEPDAGDG